MLSVHSAVADPRTADVSSGVVTHYVLFVILDRGTVNLSGLLAHKALAGDEDAQIQGVYEPPNGHSGALFGSS